MPPHLTEEEEFYSEQRFKAITKWKWKNPYLAAFLAFIHPIGMLYSSIPGAILYFLLWIAMFTYWPSRPRGVGIGLATAFAVYGFFNTKWKNAAIEKWRYGLEGTGLQNPKKLGLEK